MNILNHIKNEKQNFNTEILAKIEKNMELTSEEIEYVVGHIYGLPEELYTSFVTTARDNITDEQTEKIDDYNFVLCCLHDLTKKLDITNDALVHQYALNILQIELEETMAATLMDTIRFWGYPLSFALELINYGASKDVDAALAILEPIYNKIKANH